MSRITKIIVGVTIVTLLLGSSFTVSAHNTVNPDPYQRLIITLLYEDINAAVQEFYGENKRGYDLYNAEVTKLESAGGWAKFCVTVELITFTGAHNPPEARDQLTFYVELGKEPVLTNYDHNDM